ncbi:TIGR04222 domain-containing membrane protein, partial [Streptomyces sp. WAC05374]
MWSEKFYAAAAVLLGAAMVYRLVASLRRIGAEEGGGGLSRDVSLLELAFLAGGPGRVAGTVLVRMKREGRATVTADGLVTVHADLAAAADDVERACVAAAGVSRQEHLRRLLARTATSQAVQAIGDRLEAEGLLIHRKVLRHYVWSWRVWYAATVLPLALTAYGFVVALLDDGSWWPGWGWGLFLSGMGGLGLLLSEHRGGRVAPGRVPWRVLTRLGALRREAGGPGAVAPDAMTALAMTALGAVALNGMDAAQDPELLEASAAHGWSVTGGSSGDGGAGVGSAWCGSVDDWVAGSSGDSGDSGGSGGGG